MNTFIKLVLTIIITTITIVGGYFLYQEYFEWKELRKDSRVTMERMNKMMDKAEGAMQSGAAVKEVINAVDVMQGLIGN